MSFQKRYGRDWEHPGDGEVGSGMALLQKELGLLWQSSEKLVGWTSPGVSIRMPGLRDARLRWYGVPLKSKQRAEADQRKQSYFYALLRICEDRYC